MEEKIAEATIAEMQISMLSRNHFGIMAGRESAIAESGKVPLQRANSDAGSKFPNLPLLMDHLMTPSVRVLASYCHHVSWSWPLSHSSIQELACECMLRTRLDMQLAPVSTYAKGQVLCCMPNNRAISYAELFTDAGPDGGGSMPFVVQSVVSRAYDGQLSSDLWLEPQQGDYSFMDDGAELVLTTAALFEWLVARMLACDSHVASALFTFDEIATRCKHVQQGVTAAYHQPPTDSPKSSSRQSLASRTVPQQCTLSVAKMILGTPKKTEFLMALLPEASGFDTSCEDENITASPVSPDNLSEGNVEVHASRILSHV